MFELPHSLAVEAEANRTIAEAEHYSQVDPARLESAYRVVARNRAARKTRLFLLAAGGGRRSVPS